MSTRDGGMIATVMPHGVLFRGGDEGKIRQKIIEQDQVEAIIGLGPQLFYGTGIPACVIILRQRVHFGANLVSGKPKERQGKILFINADRQYFEGRAQNHLLPEHLEKIVTTFEEYREIPAFSAIVDVDIRVTMTPTLTSVAMPTTRLRPNRMTCGPIWWAACPGPKSWPRPTCSAPTGSIRRIFWSRVMTDTSTSPPT